MPFASHEQCVDIVDRIDALIPSERRWKIDTRVQGRDTRIRLVGYQLAARPRVGVIDGRWSTSVDFNPTIPRYWEARVNDPFELVQEHAKVGNVVVKSCVKPTSSLGTDPRISRASFFTHGLDAYGADPSYAWGIIGWKVVESAQDSSVAIFADKADFVGNGRGNSPRRVEAAVSSEHFTLDEAEVEAQLAEGTINPFIHSAEEHALRNSYRITNEGLDYLVSVLDATLQLSSQQH